MRDITTILLLEYKDFTDKCWALQMMQFAKPYLKNIKGLQFYKLLGSGKDGFKPQPDWSVYALLQVWDDEKSAKKFFDSSTLFEKYKRRSHNYCIVFMSCMSSYGFWSNQKPFIKSNEVSSDQRAIAIITRASIKTSQLRKFWKYVPITQKAISKAKGLIYTKGFGEFPIWEMATFSVWENMEYAREYAYKSSAHKKAITMTNKYKWYKEELFSRFKIYKIKGKWHNLQEKSFY